MTDILKKLVDNKILLLTNKGRYYINCKKSKQHLGFAQDTLKYLQALNIDIDSISTPEQIALPVNNNVTQDPMHNVVPDPQSAPQQDESAPSQEVNLEELLGTISNISIDSSSGGDLDVYVNGVNQLVRSCKCPVLIVWDKKDYLMDSGAGQKKINDKTVLSKSIYKSLIDQYKITFKRDDSPNMDYYSYGQLIACVVIKDQYYAKLEALRNKKNVDSISHTDRRNEFARIQASEKDPEAVQSRYADANAGDRGKYGKDASFKAVDSILSQNVSEIDRGVLLDNLMIQEGVAPKGF